MAAENTRRAEITDLFFGEGARAVVESINELESVLGAATAPSRGAPRGREGAALE